MTKKRRMFDIDLPEGDEPETFTAVKVSPEARRGPMASAITENADSLREREAIAARIREENDELAHEYVGLRQAGLIVELVPLDRIKMTKLIRDRIRRDDTELVDLIQSIREIGLSNPIRVEPVSGGDYELIQGYRRIQAYKALLEETGDTGRFGSIPASMTDDGMGLDVMYRRMVDENLVRKDISYAEMARLAVDYAADPRTDIVDPDRAVAKLFKSASYAKRSHVRTFIKIVEMLGDHLRFLPEIPRSLGLALSNQLEDIPEIAGMIRKELKELDNRSVADELDILRRYAGDAAEEGWPHETGSKAPAAKPVRPPSVGGAKAKVSFQIARPQGPAKCVAGAGRLEVRLDRDFTAIDRRRLEAAVRLMLDQLG